MPAARTRPGFADVGDDLLLRAGRIDLRPKRFRAAHQNLIEVDAHGSAHPGVVPKGSILGENLLQRLFTLHGSPRPDCAVHQTVQSRRVGKRRVRKGWGRCGASASLLVSRGDRHTMLDNGPDGLAEVQ